MSSDAAKNLADELGANIDDDAPTSKSGTKRKAVQSKKPTAKSRPAAKKPAVAAAKRRAPTTPAKAVTVPADDRVTIILEENEQIPPTGQFIGVNGKGYLLKPGIEASVPLSVIEVLDNAIEEREIVDPISREITGFRKRLRFPYRIVGMYPRKAA